MANPNLSQSPSENVNRLINIGNAAEGSDFPPKQNGYTRIPPPEGLRVIRSEALGTNYFRVTATWLEKYPATGKVGGWAVHAKNLTRKDSDFQQVSVSSRSPATFTLQGTSKDKILLTAQTVMGAGQRTALEFCPTVSFLLP